MYIDKLDYIINKCNNSYHSTIKLKRIDVKSSTYFDFNIEKTIKIRNLKWVIMKECQNVKTFLTKGCTARWSEEFFVNICCAVNICY